MSHTETDNADLSRTLNPGQGSALSDHAQDLLRQYGAGRTDATLAANAAPRSDATHPTDAARTTAPQRLDLNASRAHLIASLGDRVDADAFKANMQKFEARTQNDHLSPAEIAGTYQQISRLLDAQGTTPTTPEERAQLAGQIMSQAGDSHNISQGNHLTCNVASVETRTYIKYPAEAAQLVTEVALTGKFKAKDGSNVIVTVNPKPTDAESQELVRKDGDRSYASEIFQVAAVNLRWVQIGGMHYEQHATTPEERAAGNTGEQLYDRDGKPFMGSPLLRPVDLADISQKITGHKDKPFMMVNGTDPNAKADGVLPFQNQQQFEGDLKKLKKDGNLPALLFVQANDEPFYTDSEGGLQAGSSQGHAIVVRDIGKGPNPKTPFSNEWDAISNHDTPSTALSAHDLYRATQDTSHYQQSLADDIKARQAAGKPTDSLELALLSSQHTTKDGVDDQYASLVSDRIQKTLADWHNVSAHLSPGEQSRLQRQMENLASSTTSSDVIKFLVGEKKAGLLNEYGFTNLLAQNVLIQNQGDGSAIPAIKTALQELTPKDQQYILTLARNSTPDKYRPQWVENDRDASTPGG